MDWGAFPHFCCCMVQIWGFTEAVPRQPQQHMDLYAYVCAGTLQTPVNPCASSRTPVCTSGSQFLLQGAWKVWFPISGAFTSHVRLQLNPKRRQAGRDVTRPETKWVCFLSQLCLLPALNSSSHRKLLGNQTAKKDGWHFLHSVPAPAFSLNFCRISYNFVRTVLIHLHTD